MVPPSDSAADAAFAQVARAQQLLRAGNIAAARRAAQAARLLATDNLEVGNALGSVLYELGDLDAARDVLQDVLAHDPYYADALNNMGNILARDGKPRAAVEFYERALAAAPGSQDYLANLGGVRQALGDVAAALACFDQALTIAPGHADARWNRAIARLLNGDLAGGFADYEARRLLPEFVQRTFSAPLWSGEDVRGKTLLVHSEQGYGDTIQMVRFARLLAERGARVLLETHAPLARLMATAEGVASVIVHGDPLPPFDLHVPIMSLPYRLGLASIADIPAKCPYLSAPPQSRIAIPQRGARELRVGLVWAGRPTHKNDRNRSLAPSHLAPLAGVPNVRLFSLQLGATAADLAQVPGIVDLAPQLADFAETAAAIEALDLVIAVDTAVAHLAGALGKEVWILLPFAPDWRWLLARDTSPWYPSAKLYRQPRLGDWAGVMARISADLTARRPA